MSAPTGLDAAGTARLSAWLELAARGWHLFPVVPGGKRPAVRDWTTRATTDPDRITAFFTDHPDHNAGIACGPSGLLVIDCDTPKPSRAVDPVADVEPVQTYGGPDGWARLCQLAESRGGLPPTWTVGTPSGGRHLYFRAPIPPPGREPFGNTAGELAPLLDTRGDGGQVLAPGSRLPNGGYELLDDSDPVELPGWLVWALSTTIARPAARPVGRPISLSGDHAAYVAAARAGELQRVAQAPSGEHNKSVFTAARALGQLAAAGLLDRNQVHADVLAAAHHIITGPCDCSARDIAASIASGLRYGDRHPRHLTRETRSA